MTMHPRLPILAALLFAATLAPGAARADAEAGKAKAEPCAACHGEAGISQMENIPSLAGQPDQFLQWQLVYFRMGIRKNEAMEPIVAEMSDEDVRDLAAHFAALPPPPRQGGADDDPALTERGKAVVAQRGCANCHREDFAGQQATARLAGQREDYLLKALRDFKSGARSGGGVAAMPETVYPLNDDELRALAHYLARTP
jgi:cytochrome c553